MVFAIFRWFLFLFTAIKHNNILFKPVLISIYSLKTTLNKISIQYYIQVIQTDHKEKFILATDITYEVDA